MQIEYAVRILKFQEHKSFCNSVSLKKSIAYYEKHNAYLWDCWDTANFNSIINCWKQLSCKLSFSKVETKRKDILEFVLIKEAKFERLQGPFQQRFLIWLFIHFTYRFRKSNASDSSVKKPHSNDMQCIQSYGIPDTHVWRQLL